MLQSKIHVLRGLLLARTSTEQIRKNNTQTRDPKKKGASRWLSVKGKRERKQVCIQQFPEGIYRHTAHCCRSRDPRRLGCCDSNSSAEILCSAAQQRCASACIVWSGACCCTSPHRGPPWLAQAPAAMLKRRKVVRSLPACRCGSASSSCEQASKLMRHSIHSLDALVIMLGDKEATLTIKTKKQKGRENQLRRT